MTRLFRFVNTEKKNLDTFQKWYEDENKKDASAFPLELTDDEWYDEYFEWLDSESN